MKVSSFHVPAVSGRLLAISTAGLLAFGSISLVRGQSLPATSQYNATPNTAQCSVGAVSKSAPYSGPFDVPLDPANIQAYGQCTYWVAEKRPELLVNAVWKQGGGGNAWDWEVDAVAAGYLIDHAPRVGDVVAYPPGTYIFTQSDGTFWSAGEVGHVGYVERVDPDGSFVISEMNVTSPLHGDIALAPANSAKGAYFIHQPGSTATPTVAISMSAKSMPENGGLAQVIVTRSGSTSGALTVFYSTKGTAVSGSHYATLSGTVTIPNGSTTGTIDIQPLDDHSGAGDHMLRLTLKAGKDYLVGAPAKVKIKIVDME